MHILTLALEQYKSESAQKAKRKFIDFVVSGEALSNVFNIADLDLIGTFGWAENKAEEFNQLDQFLGLKMPELKTGRTSFYVCSDCGDISCGAITGRIEITDSKVIWKNFGTETDYSEPELETYRHIGPFEFEKQAYFHVMEQIRIHI